MGHAIVVMGVSACGKSTVGKHLALLVASKFPKCKVIFTDGDDLHSNENKAKMSNGDALTDDDRYSWLEAIAVIIGEATTAKDSVAVIACSALKKRYRAQLVRRCTNSRRCVTFVHLVLSHEDALVRSAARVGHFARPSLIASQYASLETIDDDESGLYHPIIIQVAQQSVNEICADAISKIELCNDED